jgi:hypothetical protein
MSHVVLDLLACTRAGAEMVGYSTDPRVDLVGVRARVANYVVVVHVLTGVPYDTLLGDDAACDAIEAATDARGFCFTLYADSARQCMEREHLRTLVEAYESLYSPALHALPIVQRLPTPPTPADVHGAAAAISRALFASTLRRQLPWAPFHGKDTVAYMWWFLTVEPRNSDAASRFLGENAQGLATTLALSRGVLVSRAFQERDHFHGIVWFAVAVTRDYVANVLGDQAAIVKLEPMRTGPAAAYAYIANQQLGLYSCWPDANMANAMRTSQCTFQARLAGTPGRGELEWRDAVELAAREGTPWYTMRSVLAEKPNVRRRAQLRNLSRERALGVTRTWTIKEDIVAIDDWTAYAESLVLTFGFGCTREFPQGAERWAGQPVLITHTRDDYDRARQWATRRSWPITHVVLVHNDEG